MFGGGSRDFTQPCEAVLTGFVIESLSMTEGSECPRLFTSEISRNCNHEFDSSRNRANFCLFGLSRELQACSWVGRMTAMEIQLLAAD